MLHHHSGLLGPRPPPGWEGLLEAAPRAAAATGRTLGIDPGTVVDTACRALLPGQPPVTAKGADGGGVRTTGRDPLGTSMMLSSPPVFVRLTRGAAPLPPAAPAPESHPGHPQGKLGGQ